MTIHSVAMPTHAAARRAVRTPSRPPSETPFSAPPSTSSPERGFFNAQVADVARAAGVAAGTVYLYFRSKDDLLVSIFERTMREALRGGTRRRRRHRRSRRTTPPVRPRASGPPRPRPQPGDRVPGGAAAVRQVHGAFLLDASSRLPEPDSGRDRGWAGDGRVPHRFERHLGRQDVLRRARRDGHQLDSEPPTLFARSRRRSRRRPVPQGRAGTMSDQTPIRSAAVLGAGTMGAQIAAHLANAGVPRLAARSDARRSRSEGLKRARALKPDPFFTPDAASLDHDRRLRSRSRPRSPTSTGSSRPSSSSSTSSGRCSSASTRVGAADTIVSSNTSGIPIAALAEGRTDDFRRHWLGHALLQPAAIPAAARSDSHPRHRSGGRRADLVVRRSPTSARVSSSPRTRRTSSPTASACSV